MSDPPRRFVILRHDVGPRFQRDQASHLDWMFEISPDGPLCTFATALLPGLNESFCVPATRLKPHRRRYLDYEGPISDQRGQVAQVASGIFELIVESSRQWQARLEPVASSGELMLTAGTITFEQEEPIEQNDTWQARYVIASA